jgi:glycosyltransferase involved in cell wall biosynthesis
LDAADVVTTVCGAVADALVADLGIPREQLRVVPNGADLPDEDVEFPIARDLRVQIGANANRPLWVCAGRLEEQKGQDVLLDALAEVRHRGLDYHAVFAGEGELRDAFATRAQRLGLSNRVRFVGQVEELGPLLLAADAVVMPSRWEGLPLTLLEALARARPVIASAVGGIPEVIGDGVEGRLVPAGDVTALADALESFHRRPDIAQRMGREGARRVRESYTWARVVEAFEGVYDEALGLASFDPAGASGARR